jgi:hypothetical protein
MFICGKCNQVQPPHTTVNRVVVQRYSNGQIKQEANFCDPCAKEHTPPPLPVHIRTVPFMPVMRSTTRSSSRSDD